MKSTFARFFIIIACISLNPFFNGCTPSPPDEAITGVYQGQSSWGKSTLTANLLRPSNSLMFNIYIDGDGIFTFGDQLHDVFFLRGSCVGNQVDDNVTSLCLYWPGVNGFYVGVLKFEIGDHLDFGNHCVKDITASGVASGLILWAPFFEILTPQIIERSPLDLGCDDFTGQCRFKCLCETVVHSISTPIDIGDPCDVFLCANPNPCSVADDDPSIEPRAPEVPLQEFKDEFNKIDWESWKTKAAELGVELPFDLDEAREALESLFQ